MNHTETAKTAELTKLLSEDPQEAMGLIVERYNGLLWTVSRQYLNNPEDIKDCVNETFAEFYRCRGQFNESKGSLAVFLCSIAQKRAISIYRKNRRFYEHQSLSEKQAAPDEALFRADLHMDLEKAINTLKPEDADIIRMKYYGGMSMREIAESMQLPYETVKKRCQRGLSKMRLLLMTLLIMLLIAALTACAYMVLRYFGIIPGVGVNYSDSNPFYVLEEPVSIEQEGIRIQLENAVLSEDSLIITLTEPAITFSDFNCVLNLDNQTITLTERTSSSRPLEAASDGGKREQVQLIFRQRPELPEGLERLSLTLYYRIEDSLDFEFSFFMTATKEEPLDRYQYTVTDEGGVLAIPSLEDGRLYVDLYPLSCGDYVTEPTLVRGIWEAEGGPQEDITITAEDGTVLTGTCLNYSPFSNNTFFRWDFGPAEPGDYLLKIPYMYQSAALPKDFSLTISDAEPCIGQKLRIPGSLLTIRSYSPEQPEATQYNHFGDFETAEQLRFLSFDIETENADRVLAGLNLNCDTITPLDGQYRNFFQTCLLKVQEDGLYFHGYVFHMPEDLKEGPLTISTESEHNDTNAVYRWYCDFSIPLRVEAGE